jgi:hypothetical protein
MHDVLIGAVAGRGARKLGRGLLRAVADNNGQTSFADSLIMTSSLGALAVYMTNVTLANNTVLQGALVVNAKVRGRAGAGGRAQAVLRQRRRAT